MAKDTPHFLEDKWFHTLIDSSIQQQGKILKMLENNVAVCSIISTESFLPTAEVLLNLNDFTTPYKWIQFYDTKAEMKKEFELFTAK